MGNNTVRMNLSGLLNVQQEMQTVIQETSEKTTRTFEMMKNNLELAIEHMDEEYKKVYEDWLKECKEIEKSNKEKQDAYNEAMQAYSAAASAYAAAKASGTATGSAPTPPTPPELEPLPPAPVKDGGGIESMLNSLTTQYNQTVTVQNEQIQFTNNISKYVDTVVQGDVSAYNALKEYTFDNILFGMEYRSIKSITGVLGNAAVNNSNIEIVSMTQECTIKVGGRKFTWYPEQYMLTDNEKLAYNSGGQGFSLAGIANADAWKKLQDKGSVYCMAVAATLGLNFDKTYDMFIMPELLSDVSLKYMPSDKRAEALQNSLDEWAKTYGLLPCIVTGQPFRIDVSKFGSSSEIEGDSRTLFDSEFITVQNGKRGKDVLIADINTGIVYKEDSEGFLKDSKGNYLCDSNGNKLTKANISTVNVSSNCYATNMLNILQTAFGQSADTFNGYQTESLDRPQGASLTLNLVGGITATATVGFNGNEHSIWEDNFSGNLEQVMQDGKGVVMRMVYTGSTKDANGNTATGSLPHWVTLLEYTGDLNTSVFADPYTGLKTTGAQLRANYGQGDGVFDKYRECEIKIS